MNPFDNMVPAEIYNHGVLRFRNGQLHEAMAAFSECFRFGLFQAQAAYLRGLCQKELGLKLEYPPGLRDLADHLHTIYVANNLAAFLNAEGYPATMTQEGQTCQLEARIENTVYVITIANVMGRFVSQAWRRDGMKPVSLTDSKLNPNP